MTELKPCPFCGGEAVNQPHELWASCRHTNCGGYHGATLLAWNTRTAPTPGEPVKCDETFSKQGHAYMVTKRGGNIPYLWLCVASSRSTSGWRCCSGAVLRSAMRRQSWRVEASGHLSISIRSAVSR